MISNYLSHTEGPLLQTVFNRELAKQIANQSRDKQK